MENELKVEEFKLGEQQEAAAEAFDSWYTNGEWEASGSYQRDKYFVLDGFAGTGKSTCVSTIIQRMKLRAAYMAYTGKAALVLSKNSKVNARTIHSSIYRPRITPEEEFKRLYAEAEKTEDATKKREIQDKIKHLMKPQFELNEEAFEEMRPDIIVLDECSMVNDELLTDILSFDIPVIALGDPGQLPPIDGTGALFKGAANARLTEIRRQALDNPIIEWSMKARQSITLPHTDAGSVLTDKAAKIMPQLCTQSFEELMQAHDVIIVWKNTTRRDINVRYRKMNGLFYENGLYPVKGDRLIIIKNDRQLGLFNGQFCDVLEVHNLHDTYIEMTVMPEGAKKEIKIEALRYVFDEYRDPKAKDGLRPWDFAGKQQADFGYALTCHKAQGSQWDRVMILDHQVLNWPKVREERAKWLYTAITRAVEKVTIISGAV